MILVVLFTDNTWRDVWWSDFIRDTTQISTSAMRLESLNRMPKTEKIDSTNRGKMPPEKNNCELGNVQLC